MTDEQVIKALRLCANAKDCRECPLHSMYSANCIKKLMNTTLDLVERQQEMIEAIINGQETLSKALVKKNAEIERLQSLCASKDVIITEQEREISKLRARMQPSCESYKELTEEK